ncbi:MAG: sigma 54-interacting transcriptional regulator [Planctomycetes bacterium]|nr:sigma 54-interacting transcriptional regulator [Planctomycetota bacterium]
MGPRDLLLKLAKRQGRAIGVVAGSGECARAAVQAGADLLIGLSAGVYRNLGHASIAAYLPFGNANAQTEGLLREHLLPHAGTCPIIAGLFGPAEDPELAAYLDRLKALGVQAVTHWPSVGQIDGTLRAGLEAEGRGLAAEIETLRWARAQGFETFPFSFTPDEAARWAESGADGIVLVMGVTQGIEDLQEKRDRLQQAFKDLNLMQEAVRKSGREVPCLAYGGPVTTPEDLELLFRFTNVEGFAGGSVFERLPLRDITGTTVRRFKSIAAAAASAQAETGLGQMVGRSPAMAELFGLIRRVAPYDVSVLVEGETGSGKELVAGQIHRLSSRAHQSFVTLNCGALPETLLESELFGHEKGAFTGAERRRQGKFELAHRGSLFLDEVASLSAHGQVALLRALQQREITRVGGDQVIPVDVRVIAASNVSLSEMVAQGRFRADLYHRLNQISLNVPPLRERGHDLRLLVDDSVNRLRIQLNKRLVGLSPRFMEKLEVHAWPGNVRELQHAILHAALREDGPLLEGVHFQPQRVILQGFGAGESAPRGDPWKQTVLKALRDARGNKSRAATALGVTRKTLYAWLRECGLP